MKAINMPAGMCAFMIAVSAGAGCDAGTGQGDRHAGHEQSPEGQQGAEPSEGGPQRDEGRRPTAEAEAGPRAADGPLGRPSSSLVDPPPSPELSFLIAVLGVEGGIPARVATVDSPFIVIDAYPLEAQRPVLYGPLPLGYSGAFSAEYCQQVRLIAETSQLGDDAFIAARKWLREQGGPTARVTMTRLVGPSFFNAAVVAARQAGATAPYFELDNPLELSAARAEIQLTADAISSYLGETQVIADAINGTIEAQREFAFSAGYVTLSLGAKDLWCDLAFGKGVVKVRFEATIQGLPFAGTTNLMGVKKL